MSINRNKKNNWLLFLFILSGVVVGGLIGDYAQQIKMLDWLSYSKNFGMLEPFSINLNILTLIFAIKVNISIASILGIFLSLFLYKKYR